MHAALSAQPQGTAWLVCTGALTNAALLFAIYPALRAHIRGLTIMGGAVGNFFTHAALGRTRAHLLLSAALAQTLPAGLPAGASPAEGAALLRQHALLRGASAALTDAQLAPLVAAARRSYGNSSDAAEFNVYSDPEAAAALLADGVLAPRCTLVPLDVTHQVLATAAVLRVVRGGTVPTSRVRALFVEILVFFARTYEEEFGMADGPPLHDPLALVAALWPPLFDDNGGERFEVTVVRDGGTKTEGEDEAGREGECGRTVVKMLERGAEGVRIPRTLNIDAFWCLIDLALSVAERKGGMD